MIWFFSLWVFCFVFTPVAFSKVDKVVAPALVESGAGSIRKARESAEIKTEDVILKKLEAERLKDEQKRIDKYLGRTTEEVVTEPVPTITPIVPVTSTTTLSIDRFRESAFLSLGIGSVVYPGIDNITSNQDPSLSLSFGGYAANHFLFDFMAIYSKHFVRVAEVNNVRYGVHQVSGAIALKFSPFAGRLKPYVGASGAFTGRRWLLSTLTGEPLSSEFVKQDVSERRWLQAFDVGPVFGLDVNFGTLVGLNFDCRYYINAYTDDKKSQLAKGNSLSLGTRDRIVLTGNLRLYL